jgi:hypothetical protein
MSSYSQETRAVKLIQQSRNIPELCETRLVELNSEI